jgi:hypothetical protein
MPVVATDAQDRAAKEVAGGMHPALRLTEKVKAMKRQLLICFGTLLGASLLLAIVGCGSESAGPEPASSAGAGATPAVMPGQEVAKKAPPPPPPPPPPNEDTTAKPHDSGEPPPAVTRTKAGVGSGAAGHYDQDVIAAPITVPAGAYFQAKERVAFDIQIPKSMQLYKATEGHAPRTEREFMEKIVKENDIHLPELPPGHRYVYDPAKEELLVERPR